ncbi:MAG: hypothetical protein HYR84_15410 [Planctomycetes bacterium]|nr:hypothetical protein [Planctomycetota bacterium]
MLGCRPDRSINRSTGVGRVSPTSSVGGIVLSAGSDTVNVLIRALKTQGRLTVLSRPQIMTLDNQTALIQVGATVPYADGAATITNIGITPPSISRQPTGVNLQVTPRITPDGRVLMRGVPDITSLSPIQLDLGNGLKGTIFNTQHLETTVVAADGETIMLGGLITKSDDKSENKIPWLGDLPGIGAAFRYRTYATKKTELMIIMTPQIIRNRFEAERILGDEWRRGDWKLSDVMRVHGNVDAVCAPGMLPHGQSSSRPFRIYPSAGSKQPFFGELPRTLTGRQDFAVPAHDEMGAPVEYSPPRTYVQPVPYWSPPRTYVQPVGYSNPSPPRTFVQPVEYSNPETIVPAREPNRMPIGRGGLMSMWVKPAPAAAVEPMPVMTQGMPVGVRTPATYLPTPPLPEVIHDSGIPQITDIGSGSIMRK